MDIQARPLQDKVALVTGAGSGIGCATAKSLGAAGASVVVADIDATGGNQTVSDLRKSGHQAVFVQTDVTSEEQVQHMIGVAVKTYGRLDILHNNAGVMNIHPSIEETPLKEWQRIIDVDLTGVFLGCKYGVPALKKSKTGVIINTASLAGIRPFIYGLHYTVAKSGVVMLTRALAGLLAENNIKVNCLCPTAADTNLMKGFAGTALQSAAANKYATATAMLKPEDVAMGALYLATKADFTGGALTIELTPEGKPKYGVTFEYKRKALRGV